VTRRIGRRGTFGGWITEDARELLIRTSAMSHPLETGGILAGVLVNGRPWITHVKEIPSRARDHSTYVLPAGETTRAVEALRGSDDRVGYLGDWHSHPANVGTSSLDIRTLKQSSVTGDVHAPLLVVVRRERVGSYLIDAHQWAHNHPRRLELADAGPLPQFPNDLRARPRTAGRRG
jgi:proteasome lid subunit RPN8/RPN11